MEIHVVVPGDTLSSLEREYSVPMSLIALDNGLDSSEALVPGQALVIRFPRVTHVVRPGDTLSSIARQYGLSLRALYRNNPALNGRDLIWPGQTLVISYRQMPGPSVRTNAYAYTNIGDDLLFSTLPFLSYLTPFTYGFTPTGALVVPNDGRLIAAAVSMGTAPLMHLSTLTEDGAFSNELAHLVLNNSNVRSTLISNIITTLRAKGYRGLDVDFEYVLAEDAQAYAAFLAQLTQALNPLGYPVIAALAPKTSSTQRGALYEGHDFAAVGAAVNEVLLMTYG
ncbi:MAG: LysM peptidoglycan-binding domain-containing protein [Oscillospiraceae bacterium]|nr:LysM peptidoglycan-binding domain-containing protein [Oscillospiraceae bacterium]